MLCWCYGVEIRGFSKCGRVSPPSPSFSSQEADMWVRVSSSYFSYYISSLAAEAHPTLWKPLLYIIHQKGFYCLSRWTGDNCPVTASQGLGPPANGTVLQLEVTERKVLTPINLVSGELSIRARQRGGPIAWQLLAWWVKPSPLWWGRHWPVCLSPIKHLLLIRVQGGRCRGGAEWNRHQLWFKNMTAGMNGWLFN